ncbi:IucA/IucC family C-terminal-domain containing protein [Cohnella caldifontis]|uniref:IucA/IucC family C-terminal-domain containing protein n=1 Tax=Cohnella caldifontis TaxID=3027471 RepID=UPI0023EBC544|nr:IucA/IucC family C-terminal-domain containing protein [Cohnella sp. YIM B05605]
MTARTPSPFEREELAYLAENFRLAAMPAEERALSIAASDLLDPAKCEEYVSRLDRIFPAAAKPVRASLFAKRYSYLITTSSLYAMTMFDRSLDWSIENCRVESGYRNGTWLPGLRLDDWRMSQVSEERRGEWREKIVTTIFADHLAKVWHVLSKVASISETVLWENTSVYVYWLYERRVGQDAGEREKDRIREDYDYLLKVAKGSCFGLDANPLARFDFPKIETAESDRPVRIRQTCCLAYRASDHKTCCSVCPRKDRIMGKEQLQ